MKVNHEKCTCFPKIARGLRKFPKSLEEPFQLFRMPSHVQLPEDPHARRRFPVISGT